MIRAGAGSARFDLFRLPKTCTEHVIGPAPIDPGRAAASEFNVFTLLVDMAGPWADHPRYGWGGHSARPETRDTRTGLQRMRFFTTLLSVLWVFFSAAAIARQNAASAAPTGSVYPVSKLQQSMKVDGDWDKPQWRDIQAVAVNNFIREDPKFRPVVQARMTYDDSNIYVIFRVQDRYVRTITTDIGGPVWKDSAVEFFFAPDASLPQTYFNLEVNCGGTPLLGYRPARPSVEDIKMIEIAHSLPKIVDPEITEPVTWTVEYRIPFVMLEKYSKVTRPKPGVEWRANFYKIAENNSNPHHATWSVIDHPKPTFHLPQFFGTLKFQ